MKRDIDDHLLKWKKSRDRKVLLVRGARQIGKTYSVRELGKKFENFVEVNFEENLEIGEFFKRSLDPAELIKKLSLYYSDTIRPGKTLLFFDEIQACPDALRSLRFFYEKMPELHLIAAGSLLEFILMDIPSFGVGRIESIFMFPMNFSEFLNASGEENLIKIINNGSFTDPIDPVFHSSLIDKTKVFQIIGGMPEVVKSWINNRDLNQCHKIIDNLIISLNDDFAKYKKRSPVIKLRETFYSIVYQTAKKFKYSNISNERNSGYNDSLELLINAGLTYRIFHTSARGLPLGAQIKHKKFKMLIFDTGIYQRILGLELSSFMVSDEKSLVNKGEMAELFAGIELIKGKSPFRRSELYYWHREAKSSNAEVDYVISEKESIIPIEVKAGTKGQMQSIFLFLKERGLDYGIRISGENFGKQEKILILPIYATSKIWDLIK